ncbi:MAG: hypothetical protein IPO29_03480 [Anaerolineae bacterium]|nr:hypothetical protein [Anaerolineae bacterium]
MVQRSNLGSPNWVEATANAMSVSQTEGRRDRAAAMASANPAAHAGR